MIDFLCIGAQKAGTTWLHVNLARHPRLFLPRGVKELHYWDANRHQGMDWYLSHFADKPADSLGGEITPAYAILPEDVVAEVRAAFPQLRIIYLMRNPVDRAWSAALMALRHIEMRPEEASDQWFIDHFHSAGSERRSDYEACLRTWFGQFPRERFLVLPFDTVRDDPRSILARCGAHLGVDTAPFDAIADEDLREAHYSGSGHALRPALKAHLVAHFTPRIRALEGFLDMDLSAWHLANGMQPTSPPAPPRPSLGDRLRAALGRRQAT